ncbi:toll-like receptor 2 [Branchiostoma floridae]|uniref:Toll-like receptor 2 n=1 Tax=Branchiostoma floridae TaxID=7739 RepID=A0A9J7KZE3_BRAFL|nr:toll-like receptor 2 [Branchiostoma floridae]
MRTRPVLLLWVYYAVAPHFVVTGSTPEATAASCTETAAIVGNATGIAADCSRRNFAAVPTNISSVTVILDLTFNRLHSVNRDSFKGLAQLKVLSLSYNQISTIEQGSFSELPELSELYIDHNGISSIASDFFQQPSMIENLDLSFNRIAHIGDSAFDDLGVTLKQLALGNNYLGKLLSVENSYKIFQEPTNLIYLDLSNNGIYDFRSDVFRSQSNIRSLNLSGNALRDSSLFIEVHNHSGEYVQQTSVLDSLSSLNFLDISHNSLRLCCEAYRGLTNLEHLDLRSNVLPYVEPENITGALPNLNELYLRGNPFDCSCRAAPFFRWADDSFIDTDFLNWTCKQPPTLAGATVAELDIRECGNGDLVILITICIGMNIIFVIGLVAVFVRRRRQRVKFSAFESIELEEPKYDVFISYSSHDMAWVHQSLVPHLDSLNVQSCIADRDFMPGTPIFDNIIDSIEQSRQVVIVLSRNFLDSDWCKIELQITEQKYFSSGEKYVIPILLEQIPTQMMPKGLRYLLATKTYLEWKEGRKQENLFWRRLGAAVKSSLPVKRTNNDAIDVELITTTSLAQATNPKGLLSKDTDNEVDIEPETECDHETSTSVSLNDSPIIKQQTTDHDHTTSTTDVDEGSYIDECPPSDCQTVSCSSEDHVDNPVVEDVELTKTRRQALATFLTGMFEKGRLVFFTALFRFKYTKTSPFHQNVPRSASATKFFLPKVLQESYTEEQAHVTSCHEEPIYQNSWFLYHAIRTRRKEPLPPTPDDDDTSLSISGPQTTVVHMVAIEHHQSPTPKEKAYHDSSLKPYQEHVEEELQVVQQPRLNVVTSSLATGIFDSKGGHLTIGGTGVRLFIPPGAIKDSTEHQITISISTDECDKPTLTERQARISPVIKCSPHGITFEKSVALSFPHSGEVSKGKTIHPLITNTGRGQQAVYEDIKKDRGAHAIVRKADCVVFLDHFTGVTLVEESPCADEGAKGESGNSDSAENPCCRLG